MIPRGPSWPQAQHTVTVLHTLWLCMVLLPLLPLFFRWALLVCWCRCGYLQRSAEPQQWWRPQAQPGSNHPCILLKVLMPMYWSH